jgi:hypothetical protein
MAQWIQDANDEYALLSLAFAQSIADCYAVMRAFRPRRDGAQLPAADVRQSANVADLFARSLPEGGLAPMAAAYRCDPRHKLCREAQRATEKDIGIVSSSEGRVPMGEGRRAVMRRLRWSVVIALCLWALVAVGFQESAGAVTYSNDRIAIDVDGNCNDPDDWAATPMGLALLARRGLQSKLVLAIISP